jgi:hypothetical protein
MNRLNQTEPATFSILPCWSFFRDSVFIYFNERNIFITGKLLKQGYGSQFSTIYSVGINDPEGPENIITLK